MLPQRIANGANPSHKLWRQHYKLYWLGSELQAYNIIFSGHFRLRRSGLIPHLLQAWLNLTTSLPYHVNDTATCCSLLTRSLLTHSPVV